MVTQFKFNFSFIFFLILLGLTACPKNKKEEPTPLLVDTTCFVFTKTWNESEFDSYHKEYVYDANQLITLSNYINANLDEKINFIYEDNKLIQANYFNSANKLVKTIEYKYNSNNQLIKKIESTFSTLISIYNNPIHTYFYYDGFGRISKVQEMGSKFFSLQVIYDEYNNIVEMRRCSDKSGCSLYMAYEYDYNIKPIISWDENATLSTYVPSHFLRKVTRYENGEMVTRISYLPIDFDSKGNPIKVESYTNQEEIPITYLYTYFCNQ